MVKFPIYRLFVQVKFKQLQSSSVTPIDLKRWRCPLVSVVRAQSTLITLTANHSNIPCDGRIFCSGSVNGFATTIRNEPGPLQEKDDYRRVAEMTARHTPERL